MRTTLNHAGLCAALLALFIAEPLLARPPHSPYGGVPHPTYSSQRLKQQQANSYRYWKVSNRCTTVSERPAIVEVAVGPRRRPFAKLFR